MNIKTLKEYLLSCKQLGNVQKVILPWPDFHEAAAAIVYRGPGRMTVEPPDEWFLLYGMRVEGGSVILPEAVYEPVSPLRQQINEFLQDRQWQT